MNIIIQKPEISKREEIHALFGTVIHRTLKLEGVGDDYELTAELIADQQELIDLCFETDGEECFFLTAVHEGKTVGTICRRECSDIIKDCADRDVSGVQEIGSVYILPQFQGKGIARLLLNAMYITLIAQGYDEFWLDSGYEIAKNVWAKVLGPPSIIMKDYWAEGVDHHLWHKKLDEVSIEFDI